MTDAAKQKAMDWLFNQGPVVVLLSLILIGGVYAGKWAIEVAVPKHLEQIKAGYEKIEASHERQLEAEHAAHERQVTRMLEVFERQIERAALGSKRQIVFDAQGAPIECEELR